MADATATFGIDIEETGGEDAASSLEALRAKLVADTSALREMTTAMRNLRAGGQSGSEAMAQLKEQIAAQRIAVGQAQASFVSLGGTFGKVGSASAAGLGELAAAADDAGLSTEQMLLAAKGALGPMGGLFERAGMLSRALGGVNLMAVAAGVALVALAAIVVTGIARLTQFAFAAADAARSQKLAFAAMVGGSRAGGEALAAAVNRVAQTVPQTRAELATLAEQLAKTGLRGKALEDALAAAAAKAAGPFAADKMLSFGVQADKLRDNVAQIFEGIDVGPFLSALQDLLSVFSQSSASGRALREIATQMFGAMFSAAAAVLPYLKAAFQAVLIAGMQAFIWIRPAIPALKLLGAVVVAAALAWAVTAVPALVSGAIAAATAFGAMAVSVIAATWPFLAIGAVIVGVYLLFTRWRALPAMFSAIWSGIKTGALAVWNGIKAMANGIWAAIKTAFALIAAAAAAPFLPIIAAVMAVVYVFRNWDKVGPMIASALASAWSTITGWLGNLGSAIQGGLSSAWSAVTGFVGQFASAGANLISGLVQGIASGAGAILDALLAPVKAGVAAVKNFLGIHSPSRLMMGLGGHTAAGFAAGLDAGSGDVADAAGAMAGAAATGAAGAPGAAGRAGPAGKSAGRGAVTLNLTVNAMGAGAADIAQAAREAVVAALEEAGLLAGAELA